MYQLHNTFGAKAEGWEESREADKVEGVLNITRRGWRRKRGDEEWWRGQSERTPEVFEEDESQGESGRCLEGGVGGIVNSHPLRLVVV